MMLVTNKQMWLRYCEDQRLICEVFLLKILQLNVVNPLDPTSSLQVWGGRVTN